MARYFLEPTSSVHRQYEALRSYFVERLSSKEAAERFSYRWGSFRVLCHEFRSNPERAFFAGATKTEGGKKERRDPVREKIIAYRKQNFSIYDISRALSEGGTRLSPVSISTVLRQEGFARLPRRKDDERPVSLRAERAAVADCRRLDLARRTFRTKFGGLFLFLAYLASVDLDKMLSSAGFPGSRMVPGAHAIRSLLALKLFGSARHSHVMSYVLDEGPAFFAGLNAIPKRSFLTEYSCRIDPECYHKLMRQWFEALAGLGLKMGGSFDLDFHTIPFHGQDALVEKHYVSKRSRRQKGILAFVAEDAGRRVFCYGNAEIRKQDQVGEILRFVEFSKARTGRLPEELIFDSKLTTYANLDQLNKMGIGFITLRRRSKKMTQDIYSRPSAFTRIELRGVSRKYRTPKILDRQVELSGYEGAIRQISIIDLGHEEPTLLLTNRLRESAAKLISRYASRMIVENSIADAIDFFHMDALSSAVAMKVNLDLQLTLMAGSLYRLLGERIGGGYERAKSRHIFRDFIDATAQVTITDTDIVVHYQKRAHNPLLIAAGFADTDVPVPWLAGKRLRLVFG